MVTDDGEEGQGASYLEVFVRSSREMEPLAHDDSEVARVRVSGESPSLHLLKQLERAVTPPLPLARLSRADKQP